MVRRATAIRPRRLPGWLVRLAVAARVLFVLAAFQVSGGPHVLASLLHDTTCIDDCSRDGDDQCPPGCPDCVCVHGHLPSTLPVPLHIPELVLLDELLIDFPHEDLTPPSPPHDSVERPPRA